MITLEDLLEEIVGEIRDEYDADEDELIQEIGERQYLVEGGMKLDDINDALGTERKAKTMIPSEASSLKFWTACQFPAMK